MLDIITPEITQMLRQKKFAEFFAGIGLIRAGLERQGWSIAFANDIDPLKYKMYKGHFKDADLHFILDDIYHIPAKHIPRVTLATASFPCKDLSLAGGREGLDGEHSSTFWGFINIIRQMNENKPPLIMIENVLGFLSVNGGKDFLKVLNTLNSLGYLVDSFILDAINFVPQSRQRLFIVGLSQNIFVPVKLTNILFNLVSDTRPKILTNFILKHPEIKWSIRQLPQPPINTIKLEEVLEEIPETSPLWWSKERSTYLLNQMSLRHREVADTMIASNQWCYGTVFRRMRNKKSTAELRTDGIAGCLRTPLGGSAKQILFKGGYGKYFVRLITPQEAAGLMGIKDYNITVSFDQGLFGFGDAVCVPVIEWITEHYLNPAIDEII